MSSSGSGTVINYGSGSDFLTTYGSSSTTLITALCIMGGGEFRTANSVRGLVLGVGGLEKLDRGANAARLFFLTAVAIAIATRPFKFHEISVSNSSSSFVSSIHSFEWDSVHQGYPAGRGYTAIKFRLMQFQKRISHTSFPSIKYINPKMALWLSKEK